MATFVKDANGNYKYVPGASEMPVSRSLGFSSAYSPAVNTSSRNIQDILFNNQRETSVNMVRPAARSIMPAVESAQLGGVTVMPAVESAQLGGVNQQFSGGEGGGSRFVPEESVLPAVQSGVDPITKFNQALLRMLEQAQKGTDNTALFNQQEALQREGIARQSQMTPEELRDLSPEQQRQIRSGSVAALEPEQDYVAAAIKARDNRLQNFESVLNTARQIGGDIMDNIAPSKDVVAGYKNMLLAGANLTSIPEEIRDQVVSGMNSGDLAKWQSANAKQTTTTTERATTATSGAIAMARPALQESVGEDGYVDPGIYTRLRLDFVEKYGNVDPFDNAFALLLSPKERARLGIGEYAGYHASGYETGQSSSRSDY